MKPVDVVIPVYDGLEETQSCIESVLKTVDKAWARLVVVNDQSPNPEITEYLRQLARKDDAVILLENENNLGFVATANRGMKYDPGRDVLLLNSDVEVSGNWLSRLQDAAYTNENVASVTPFSNNATICSFPNFCQDNELAFGLSVADLDSFFAQNFQSTDVVSVPTGVGFCMYIPRDSLDRIGYFDVETFGKGYGEENDWCQRAIACGYENLHLANCFVYHKGGVSFGSEHNPRVGRAQEILDQKYPSYHSDIQQYIAADPAGSFRIRSIMGLFAAQNKPKVLLLTHKLGGGAQQHVDELASTFSKQALFVQITPEQDGESIALNFFDDGLRLKDGLSFQIESEYELLLKLLRELGVGAVHFHHTMGLHPRLWKIADDLACRYDLTIHDYYLINGNPTLTDDKARFVSEELADFDQQCAGHYPLPENVTAQHWRESQRLLVEGARRVIFPSIDCCDRFLKFFSVTEAVVAWHPDYRLSQPYPSPQWSYTPQCPLRVLAMGALSREKGADELEAVAVALRQDNIEFHLLGYAYRALAKEVITHGPYDNREAYALIEDIAPDVIWFPALWPETYSYTLSIALHCGVAVVAPNIGAFVERVQGRAHSAICPWNNSRDQWLELWQQVLQQGHLPTCAGGSDIDLGRVNLDFYQHAYLSEVPANPSLLQESTFLELATNYRAQSQVLSIRERVLSLLWRVSRSPLVASIVALIPFKLKQAIKRRFSDKPMHDIVGR